VTAVAFSPDGKTLTTGDVSGTVQLWGATTPADRRPPHQPPRRRVSSVAFSPHGKTLATGSTDDMVRLWNVATPSQSLAEATNLVRYLCALAGRSLTRTE
jgi:WD40 repeat protein